MSKKILFITGTRADFGKQKTLKHCFKPKTKPATLCFATANLVAGSQNSVAGFRSPSPKPSCRFCNSEPFSLLSIPALSQR